MKPIEIFIHIIENIMNIIQIPMNIIEIKEWIWIKIDL